MRLARGRHSHSRGRHHGMLRPLNWSRLCANTKDMSMNRFVRIPLTGIVCVLSAGLALAQTAPPATQAGAPPPTVQGAGRGGFVPVPVVIGPPAPVPPEVAIPRPTSEE